ncbi:4Fe-4S binding protein [Chloroflexota bacterium]
MLTTKTIKTIKIDPDKCTGCRACEIACSAFHADPKYSTVNPERSRIRVFWDMLNDVYVPIIAGEFTETECNARYIMTIDGKEYGECSFCRSSCPSRDIFKEPGSGVALKCDACGEPMPEGGPWCVQWCESDALTYAPERTEEVEVAEEEEEEEVEEL